MKRLALLLALAACGGSPAPTTPTTPTAAVAKTLVNVDAEGTAILGFDAVGYSTGAAVPGAGEHAVEHGGARYWFATPEAKATFAADPAKYAPLYGGYCAYAASQGRLSPIEPEAFEIYEGQLLLFTNADFKAKFDADPAGSKAKADANWPALVEKHGK